MASRLSDESLLTVLDAGQQSLALHGEVRSVLLSESVVNFDALLNLEDPTPEIQALPAQIVLRSLLAKGPEDCLEVLPYLSTDQVQRILDYDAWDDTRLAPLRFIRWMELFKEVSPQDMVQRFRDLDEEYQLAVMGPVVQIIDADEFEKIGEAEQDQFQALPCQTLYYKITSDDPRVANFVTDLLQAALDMDVAYAYSLLAHASYMPPAEQEALTAQFRQSRLEEDGFLSFTESLQVFKNLDWQDLQRKWDFILHPSRHSDLPTTTSQSGNGSFLAQVLRSDLTPEDKHSITSGLMVLANSLCGAARVGPEDQQSVNRLMLYAEAAVSLGLQCLARGDIKAGKQILSRELPRTLFATGLSLITSLTHRFLDSAERSGFTLAAALKQQLKKDQRGALSQALDTAWLPLLGFEHVEVLKGVLNRFPLRPEAAKSGRQGVVFAPIASIADLQSVAVKLSQIAGLMHLAGLADAPRHLPLDQQLGTALAHVLLSGEFKYASLADSDCARLLTCDGQVLEAFLKGVEGTLTLHATAWTLDIAPVVTDGREVVRLVIDELSDLVLRLLASIKTAREQGDTGALKTLIVRA